MYTQAAFVKIQITVTLVHPIVARRNGRNGIPYGAVRVRKNANCHSVDVLLRGCVRAIGMRVTTSDGKRAGDTTATPSSRHLVAKNPLLNFGVKKLFEISRCKKVHKPCRPPPGEGGYPEKLKKIDL